MQAKFIPIALAAFMSVAGTPGIAAAVETLSCEVTALSGNSHLPSELSILLLKGQKLAAVGSSRNVESHGRPVLASLQQKSAESFVLSWEVERPGGLGGPAPAPVLYRAVLNMRNLKITVLASALGQAQKQWRGTGRCATKGY